MHTDTFSTILTYKALKHFSGAINPAALSRTFTSFLRKGQDCVPGRLDLTTGAGLPAGDTNTAQQQPCSPHLHAKSQTPALRAPPTLEMAYSLDMRSAHRPASEASWNPVALSSQQVTHACTYVPRMCIYTYVCTSLPPRPHGIMPLLCRRSSWHIRVCVALLFMHVYLYVNV